MKRPAEAEAKRSVQSAALKCRGIEGHRYAGRRQGIDKQRIGEAEKGYD